MGGEPVEGAGPAIGGRGRVEDRGAVIAVEPMVGVGVANDGEVDGLRGIKCSPELLDVLKTTAGNLRSLAASCLTQIVPGGGGGLEHLNVRAEMTAIDRLRSRMRHAGLTAGCTCRDCEEP